MSKTLLFAGTNRLDASYMAPMASEKIEGLCLRHKLHGGHKWDRKGLEGRRKMKTVIVFLVSLSLLSCSQLPYRQELEERDTELFGPPQTATYAPNLDDSRMALLLSLYALCLAKNPHSRPLFFPSLYFLSPLSTFSDLMIYQSMLDSITRMERYKLELEIQRMLDEAKKKAESIKD